VFLGHICVVSFFLNKYVVAVVFLFAVSSGVEGNILYTSIRADPPPRRQKTKAPPVLPPPAPISPRKKKVGGPIFADRFFPQNSILGPPSTPAF